jgi:hypothetical protein
LTLTDWYSTYINLLKFQCQWNSEFKE